MLNHTIIRKISSMHRSALLGLLLVALLPGCSVGPDYQRPAAPIAAAYKEAGNLPAWKFAEPDVQIKPDRWWQLYDDGHLNALMNEVALANQDIKFSEARYRQALALTDSARAALSPSLNLTTSINRGTGTGASVNNIVTTHSAAVGANWEVDLWGRLHSQVESNETAAEASAADLAAAKLSVQASFVQTYFQIRIADVQQRLLDDTVQAYESSLQLTQNRFRAGIATPSDVAQAEAQLKSTQALALDNHAQRAQLEHALAVLLGRAAAEFTLASNSASQAALQPDLQLGMGRGNTEFSISQPDRDALRGFRVPIIPTGLPSRLLERRPDVVAAERRIASANAAIGVAHAAIFPNLTLAASTGFQSSQLSQWLTLPNRLWSLGPTLAASLFDGGMRRAQTDSAVAAYDATVASYRQTVLTSMQDVEDNLATLVWLAQEAEVLDTATRAARQSEQEVLNRYQAGIVDYLSVVTSQTTALSIERNALTVLGRRLTASAGLIKALGGGWESSLQ